MLEFLKIKIKQSFESNTFIKFLIVGVCNTFIAYAVYFILLQVGLRFFIAAGIGQIAGIINSYFMNKHFTFKSKSKSKMELVRFLIVYAFQYLFQITFIYFMPFSYELAGLMILPLNPIISFLGHKYFTFKIRVVK
ncbi:MAG: GtrA family protein [Defluviitaleaceae bacterium]|nr:GtrA family protein [Defluviitaleaceae bacterium]